MWQMHCLAVLNTVIELGHSSQLRVNGLVWQLILACAILQVVEVTASTQSAAVPQGALSFKGRRAGTSNVRRKLATSAVIQNYKPPPTAKPATVPKGPMQRTINELFCKQAAANTFDHGASYMQLD